MENRTTAKETVLTKAAAKKITPLKIPGRNEMGRNKIAVEDKFWEKVDTSGKCWEWTASKNNRGYGDIRHEEKHLQAHRVAYSLVFGGIPEGLCVCHHCDNPGCVKPSHLFLGTHKDNIQDAVAKGRFDNRGEKHGMSKLVENDVYEIRRLHATGRVTQALLSKMWRISRGNISDIVLRKTWGHT